MRVSGFTWAGVRTQDFESTAEFFEEILGLPLTRRDDAQDLATFRMPSGQHFEVFGPRNNWNEFMPCPVIGWQVQDVAEARKELEEKGVEFVTNVAVATDGSSWTYFRGPDGHYYEICHMVV